MSDFLSETLSHNRKSEWIPFDTGSGWQGVSNRGEIPGQMRAEENELARAPDPLGRCHRMATARFNLPLAACPRVGHIGPAGDVAEWLKAAVC
jgi:hypothetical protein